MMSHRVCRAGEPFEVLRDRFMPGAQRQGEVLIVRLSSAATRSFVHHEISTMRLDRRFEPVDGLDHVEQFLRALGSGQFNPEHIESASQLA